MEKAMIVGTYSIGCFCDKPELKPVVNIDYRPRFEFMKAAREFCRVNNLYSLRGNKGIKVATAVSDCICKHGTRQLVRIDWCLQYGEVIP